MLNIHFHWNDDDHHSFEFWEREEIVCIIWLLPLTIIKWRGRVEKDQNDSNISFWSCHTCVHLLLSGTSKETTFHRYETSQAAEVSRSTWFAAIHVKRAENIAQKNLRPPTMLFCSRPQEFQEKSTSYHVAHWAKLLLTETFFKYLTSKVKWSLMIFCKIF